MATWSAVLAALFKPVILPLLTWFVGWLIPSPTQMLAKKFAATAEAQKKANAPKPDSTGLDKI